MAGNIVDYSIGHGIGSMLLIVFFRFVKLTGTNVVIDFMIIFTILNVAVLSQVLYQVLFVKKFGFTFGRYVFKVELSSNENILKREIIKWYLVYSSLCIYIVICAFMVLQKKKCYHEEVSNCYVI